VSKTILKLRPNDYWRIGEHESWFADMAANGLHLKKTGLQFAKFEKGEPKKTKYRIDVTKDKLTEEQKNLYRDYGWEFVTSYGKFNVYSSPEELEAPELHTDAAEQSYTLEALADSLRQNVIIMSIVMVVFIGMMLSIFFLIKTPFLFIIDGQLLQQCLIVIINLYSFYNIIQASRSIRALKKSLSEGKPIDHHANWRKNRWVSYSVGGIFIVAAIITIIFPIMSLVKMEEYTLPEGVTSLPILQLAEIEQNSELARESYYMNDGVDLNNKIAFNWSPFAPVQYRINERGVISSDMWKDGSGKYSPSINTKYYKLTIAGMAKGVINDLMKRSLYRPEEEIQIISHPDFDNLYIVEDKEVKQIFASIGKNVIYIRYHGYANMDRIVALVSQKLSKEPK
jgi:hypothetical protein